VSKKVKKDILNNIFSTIIGILSPLLIIPILTTSLGLDVYGEYVTLLAKITLFTIIAELGLGMYLAKEVSVYRDDINKLSTLFCIYIFIKLFVFTIICISTLFYVGEFDTTDIIYLLFLFFNIINITPILMGLENYQFLTRVQIFTKAIMVLLVLLVDFSSFGLEKAIAIQMFITGLTSIFLFAFFLKQNKLKVKMFRVNDLKLVIEGCLPFYGAKFFVNLYQQSSTYLVSLFLLSEQVAIYSIGLQFYKLGQSIIGAVSRVLYTSTVNTKNFSFVKNVTVASVTLHLLMLPVVYFLGDDLLSLVFSFEINILFNLSLLLYTSLIASIISSYWGYPALAAINKENYAHLGILIASVVYFIVFSMFYLSNSIDIKSFIYCIIIADVSGMFVRLYYANKFNLLWK
jgi:hypothetical protein